MKKIIAKSYDKIAKEYTEKHGYNEQLSIPSLKIFLTFLPIGAEILDVGCGGGQDSKFLANKGCLVVGLDVSKKMIELAKKHAPEIKFKNVDVMKMLTSKKYDGIWCCRVFHHISVKKQDKFLAKLKTLLKKDGILYITSVVSDKKEDYEAFDSGNDSLLKKRLTEKSFKNLLIRHGFEILKFKYWVGKKGMEIFCKNYDFKRNI
ncbi:MAG: class I SAM-dependent methyltransferase [Candidatus Uhrbacteria bacterium]